MNFRKKINSQLGAVSVLVLITVLTFITVLTGAFLTATTLKKSQLESDIRLQEIYAKDVERVDEMYNDLMAIDRQKPTCIISTEVLNETNAKYTFKFDEAVEGFSTDIIKVYNGVALSTTIGDTTTLSSSSFVKSINLNANKSYVVAFDYKCVTDSKEFYFGIYNDDVATNQVQMVTASTESMHKETVITTTENEINFKFVATIEDSNNITLSNIKIIELEDNEAQKGAFVKLDNKTYTLTTFINSNEQVVIVPKNTFTDTNNNKNLEIVKTLKK